jgi:hypothetical protein
MEDQERNLNELMVAVNRVGIKRAIEILSEGLSPTELAVKRQEEYSDWISANLNRLASGQELLPRLPWDKKNARVRTYGDR